MVYRKLVPIPIGTTFGSRVVTSPPMRKNGRIVYDCRCKCGAEGLVMGACLLRGERLMCHACQLQETQKAQVVHGATRGGDLKSEYTSWSNMRSRCRNPKSSQYRYYGAKGIRVCERWDSFENFIADMGRKPSQDYTIERKENTGNYEPGNCLWATHKVQMRNKFGNRLVVFQGEEMPLATAVERAGYASSGPFWFKARNRLDRGWTVDRALLTP